MSTNTRYVFGPRDRRGFLLGLRLGQLAILATGAALVLGIVMATRASVIALVAVMAVAIVAGLAALLPVHGRGLDEWAPAAAHFTISGRRAWRSPQPRDAQHLAIARGCPVVVIPEQPAFPLVLRGCTIQAVSVPRGKLGVVKDPGRGTWTGVLRLQGSSYVLLDTAEKARRMAAWGVVQSALAHHGTPISALQVVVRSRPERHDAVARHLAERCSLDLQSPVLRSYLSLIDGACPVTWSQDVHLALQVSARRGRRQIREAGGGDLGAGRLLTEGLQALQSQLERADIAVDGALPPRLLGQTLREAWDPAAVTQLLLARRRDPGPEGEGVAPANAGPLCAQSSWGYYETDSALHASYWVSEWPRTPAGPDYLIPLLLQSGVRVAVSVCMEPLDPIRARRDLETARTEQLADEELRRRHGFRTSIASHRQADAVERREAELADGHAEFRFSGHITVSADSVTELERACQRVEEQSRASCLEVRRMDGEHDLGFCCTLPLCRGIW
jgi:hypothetical protein